MTLPYQPNNPPPPQLTEAHLQQLAAARVAAKRLRRAAGVANFDGWTLAFFAGLTLIFAIVGFDVQGIVGGVALTTIAFIELRGAARLRVLDPAAPRILALNQLALSALIILYAIWRLYQLSKGKVDLGPGFDDPVFNDPTVGSMKGDASDMAKQLMLLLYGGLIAIAVFAQGGLALYYFTRAQTLRSYLEQTPPWILQMQKSGVPI